MPRSTSTYATYKCLCGPDSCTQIENKVKHRFEIYERMEWANDDLTIASHRGQAVTWIYQRPVLRPRVCNRLRRSWVCGN